MNESSIAGAINQNHLILLNNLNETYSSKTSSNELYNNSIGENAAILLLNSNSSDNQFLKTRLQSLNNFNDLISIVKSNNNHNISLNITEDQTHSSFSNIIPLNNLSSINETSSKESAKTVSNSSNSAIHLENPIRSDQTSEKNKLNEECIENSNDKNSNKLNKNRGTKASVNTGKQRGATYDGNLCMICSDRASGFHYGVLACEGTFLLFFLV